MLFWKIEWITIDNKKTNVLVEKLVRIRQEPCCDLPRLTGNESWVNRPLPSLNTQKSRCKENDIKTWTDNWDNTKHLKFVLYRSTEKINTLENLKWEETRAIWTKKNRAAATAATKSNLVPQSTVDRWPRRLTWISAKWDNVGERAVALVVARLDLDEIRRVRRETFNSGRHLVADDTFHHPIAITLWAIRRVEDDVTLNV